MTTRLAECTLHVSRELNPPGGVVKLKVGAVCGVRIPPAPLGCPVS